MSTTRVSTEPYTISPSDAWAVRDLAAAAARRIVRLRVESGVRTGLAWSASFALPILGVAFVAGMVLGSFPWIATLVAMATCVATGLVGGAIWGLGGWPSRLAAAKTLDDRCGHADHISSALLAVDGGVASRAGAGGDAVDALLVRRAAELARRTDLSKAFGAAPASTRPWQPVPALLAALLALAIPFVDFAPSADASEDAAFLAAFREALAAVSAELERTAEDIEREADDDENPEAKKIGEELRKVAEDLAQNDPGDKERAMRRVGRAIQQNEKEKLPLSFAQALKKAVGHLRQSKHTEKVAEKLEGQKFGEAGRKASELGEGLPSMKLTPEEANKLREAAHGAAKALADTELHPLAEKLQAIAKALEKNDPTKAGAELKDLAAELDKLKNLPGTQRMLGKALDALKKAQADLAQAGKGGDGKNLPFMDLKMPPGDSSKPGEGAKQQPFAILPGPMRPGGNQGGGQGQGGPIYKGPCSFDCDFEGQCIKCPCRGKKEGICPKSRRKNPSPCDCRTCQSQAGGGGGGGGGQGGMPGAGGGAGGLKPGWGSQDGHLDEASKPQGRARRTRVSGILGEKGESAVMAVKSANDGSRAGVDYQDVFSEYQRVAEESLYRDEVPLSKRDHVRRYFDSIKPREK